MNRFLIVGTVLLLALAPGAASAGDDLEAQKAIFLKLRRAAEAPTFEGANLILDNIRPERIDDADLASLYSLSKEFADFCTEVGIPRDAKVDYLEIISRLDYGSILAKLVERGVNDAPAAATRLVAKALKLKGRLPLWEELDDKLAEKYGIAPPPRTVLKTVSGCAGRYTWRTVDRSIDFDLKSDGTFTAYNKPDEPKLEDLVRDAKGTWSVVDDKLTIRMTHVWVGVYWKEYKMAWISGELISSATDKKLELQSSQPLIRK
jgi:hypothetical protein